MCREFRSEPLDESTVRVVVDAAFRGPAAGNTDALDLVVLAGDQVASYWDLTLPAPRRDAFAWPGLLRAPVLVLPYVAPGRYVERYSRDDKTHSGLGDGVEKWSVPYWWVDGGAAVMAMLLAAEAEGLGALLFGQFDHEPALRHAFGVPPDRRALGTIALGHPTGDDRPSRSALHGRPQPAGRVHRGGWVGGAPAPSQER
jgi:nitroreductase